MGNSQIMNKAILRSEVQKFLHDHLEEQPSAIALRRSPFGDVKAMELAVQLDGLRRSRKKLPLWFHTSGIYFPSLLSIEQTSSSITALYKRNLIEKGETVIDLTGGFGVDSYYFSTKAKEVHHCEYNVELSQIAAHNASRLHADNIFFHPVDGVAYLTSLNDAMFGTIYVDPSRRVKQQKVFRLQDCEPDVVGQLSLFLTKAEKVLIKAAPLLDIKAALKDLQYVKEVHIVSTQNECKELLFLLESNYTKTTDYLCIALDQEEEKLFKFTEQQEQESKPNFSNPRKYIYEPDAALLKAGCFKYTAIAFNLCKLHQHTHLYTSDELNKSFIGRSFEVVFTERYADFKKKKEPIKANVSTRNFPLKPDDLKKKHKIKDGGVDYLFFCTGLQDELLVVHCRSVNE